MNEYPEELISDYNRITNAINELVEAYETAVTDYGKMQHREQIKLWDMKRRGMIETVRMLRKPHLNFKEVESHLDNHCGCGLSKI